MVRQSRRPVLPPLVDDSSPIPHTRKPSRIECIDFGRSSLTSVDELSPAHVQHGPDMAVIEELESIREMIESKSHHLHVRESTLSRSISKWNSEVVTAHKLVEELSENLIAAGEQRVADAYFEHSARLECLLEKLSSRLLTIQAFQAKVGRKQVSADIPPFDDDSSPSQPVGIDECIEFLSLDAANLSRGVAVASLIAVAVRGSHRSVLGLLLSGICGSVHAIFNERFISLLHSPFLNSTSDPDASVSRFGRAKQSLLHKRLGVLSIDEKFLIEISESSLGLERPVDVASELADDERLLLAWNAAMAGAVMDEPALQNNGRLKLWSEFGVQNMVLKNIRKKHNTKDIRYKLTLTALMPAIDSRRIEDLMQSIAVLAKEDMRSVISHSRSIFTISLFTLIRLVDQDKSSSPTTTTSHLPSISLIVDTLSSLLTGHGQLKLLFAQFFQQWTQLGWVIMSSILTSSDDISHLVLSLLEFVDDLSSLRAWVPVLIEAVEKVGGTRGSRLKSLIRRISN